MNQEKMGLFIAELRKEKNMSQYDLAELIPISRDAVSKWERGKRCPEPDCLIKLSEIFDVSINEVLYGERTTKSNRDNIEEISIKLYNERNKKQKTLKILVCIILLLILSFLVYYFISTYNSLKVYHIYYDSEDITIPDGVLVMTNEKVYFNLGGISSDKNIKFIELFFKDEKENDNLIIKIDSNNIIFTDFKGYNAYIDFKSIKNIIKKLYLKIYFDDSEEIIKLNYEKNFSNDYFIPKEEGNSIKNEIDYASELNIVEEKIKDNFSCNDNFCTKTLDNYGLIYDLNARILTITFSKKNEYEYEWIYSFLDKQLVFQEYYKNKLVNKFIKSKNTNNCEIGDCENINDKINTFYDIIRVIN